MLRALSNNLENVGEVMVHQQQLIVWLHAIHANFDKSNLFIKFITLHGAVMEVFDVG